MDSISQGIWVKNSKKKNISREASGDAWGALSMPNGPPRALRRSRKKNQQKIEIFEKCQGGLGEVGGTSEVPSHLIPTHPVPPKITFFTTQILTDFDPPGGIWATEPQVASAGIAKRNQLLGEE